MRTIFIGLLLLIATGVQAQWVRNSVRIVGPNTRLLSAEVQKQQFIHAKEHEAFTSLAVRFKGSLNGAFVKRGLQTINLLPDEHYDGEGQVSNLVIFDEPVYEFDLYTGDISGNIEIIFINAGEGKKSGIYRQDETGDVCEEPIQVDQNILRAGLPEPDYNRSFTDVENIIIHHSATSNELTDYTNVVRNIYLFHTQSNGWSDIGYNYLIAPDGTIFKGRDPADGAQDQVLGAHFCGKNSTTMGICIMGTYTDIPPSEKALEALNQLLAWKADKDDLNPLGIDPHPLNASLPVIAGHRDGCSTECPGQQTYERLPQIRIETAETIEECHAEEEEEELVFALYPNPAHLYFHVNLIEGSLHQFRLYNMKGHYSNIYPVSKNGKVVTFSVWGLASGMYVLHYQSDNKLIKKRLVILN